MHFHLAYTNRINAPGATPVLNKAQIWAGLQRKIRNAHEFVPFFEACQVLEDEDGVVTREVTLRKEAYNKDKVKEVVTSYWPTWVDFVQEDGTVIRNIVADGPSGELEDLHMTYVFEHRLPHIKEGTHEAEEELKKFKGMAEAAVEMSVKTIRQMVLDGRIQ